jgi:hypothetical protein
MPQKTNFNVSPYYDDFDPDKNYYRVLFKPGYPIQARELTTIQSSLQNQLESFGSNIFKEGSVVIPGSINYDPYYYSVKINLQNQGIDVLVYIDSLVGKKVRGQNSGITAIIKDYSVVSSQNSVQNLVLFVKYIESGTDGLISSFLDGEVLLSEETFSYGNAIINANESVATLISLNATAVGSAVGISTGVYFARGTFVNVSRSILVLDPYSNETSFRVGLNIIEEIVSSKDDPSLYDNAKGFSNYAAPGSDRLKISAVLSKKLLTDFDDKNFIELIRIDNGQIKKIEQKGSQYNLIKDYFAKRTFEESGDYSLNKFGVEVLNSLNDGISNSGIFFNNQLTDQGNIPKDDLMCVRVSPGEAYVRGFDIDKSASSIVDSNKPRTTDTVGSALVPFQMGNLIKVNNVSGTPFVGINNNYNTINLQNQRSNSQTVATGTTIGKARVYSFSAENSPYSSDETSWNLYCFDVQTYTTITLNQSLTDAQCPKTSYIKGASSGASGYAVSSGGSSTIITLSQTSGTFISGEQIYINESLAVTRSIISFKEYGIQDVKSVYQDKTNFVGLTTCFVADTVLRRVIPNQFSINDKLTINPLGIATCPGRSFVGIKSDAIIRYQRAGLTTETYNRVVNVSADGYTLQLAAVPTNFGVNDGQLPTSTETVTFSLGLPKIQNEDNPSLYVKLPNNDISYVNLNDSSLEISGQFKQLSTNSSGDLSVNISNLGITSAFFNTFDTQRYSIFYENGSVEDLTEDQFTISSNGTVANFKGLVPNQSSSVTVNVSVRKNSISSKTKNYIRSEKIIVDKASSGISTALSGLTTSPYYGLRVSDREISLNFPDVVKVVKIFESLNTANPVLDKLTFVSGLNLDTSVVIGEKIIGKESKAIAQVIATSPTQVEICYLNSKVFTIGETVTFQESNISSIIQQIVTGSYLDITNNFVLDKGQKEQYYDYSKIIRKDNTTSPSRKLLIVFDRYEVPSNDNGDLYTVNSYSSERYGYDIPKLLTDIRCSDTLDFRPRVSKFNDAQQSPFDFDSRNFGTPTENTGLVVTPNESSVIGYSYYLPRIDKIVLNKDGIFNIVEGSPSLTPKEPNNVEDSMTIGIVKFPAYLYDPKDAEIVLVDNRRYTMRDIGSLENRILNLEKITSLSLLELDTKTLQIQDSDGLSRFKTGFFVDDFKNRDLMNFRDIDAKCDIDTTNTELITQTDFFTIKPQIGADSSVNMNTVDISDDILLLDPNVRKTGDLATLSYQETGWIEQPLASRVENVNPFNVIDFSGGLQLNPVSDNWVRTVFVDGGTRTLTGDSDSTYVETLQTSSQTDTFIRSRNVSFFAGGLKPFTRHYPFFDSVSGIDYVPKLLEISMTSGVFQVGETIRGFVGGSQVISFRVAQLNHKTGSYNSPVTTFSYNPFDRATLIPSAYSASSTLLNIDLISLSEQSQGKYSGYVTRDTVLIGETSNAQASINDIKLISDGIGDIYGAFFFRDPLSSPPPLLRFSIGRKTFRLSSSEINGTQLAGQLSISSAENTYTTSGVVETYSQTNVIVRRPPPPPPPIIIQPITIINPPPPPVVVVETIIREIYIAPPPPPPPPPPPAPRPRRRKDPLAQTFTVDETGAFLTSVDLYFAKKDPKERVHIEIRTTELATPTEQLIQDFARVSLEPSQVNVSNNASVATNVKFPSPVFLEADTTYAIVILAPTTDNYEVWSGRMGEKTINTQNLPNAESLVVSKQYVGGSLFKSQNGSIWTESQVDDMKFKLYKASFTPSGTLYFYNSPLGTQYQTNSSQNSSSIRTLPRRLTVGITTTYVMNSILSSGRKVSDGGSIGYINNVGGAISNLSISNVGVGYSNGSFTNVPLYNINGYGVGAIANLQFSGNKLTSITSIAATGNGYSAGDILGITTSSVSKGSGSKITVSTIDGIDTLYLSNVSGETFSSGNNLVYYPNSTGTTTVSLANTSIRSSLLTSNLYDGSVMEIRQFNHGMHSDTNIVQIENVSPDTVPISLTASLGLSDTTISVASTEPFATFEGISTSRGYVKVNNEIIYYNNIGSGTLGIGTRGVDSSLPRTHDLNSLVYKYELNKVSLTRINTTFSMPINSELKNLKDIDVYHLNIDRSDRNIGSNQLSFADQKSYSGEDIRISHNVQYNMIEPRINSINPSQSTSISAQIKTITGTSSGGSESSFISKDYEPITLNKQNKLNSTRLICSEINEKSRLSGDKSITLSIDLKTSDPNLSPVVDLQNTSIIFGRSRLNRPITNYAYDGRVNLLSGDPHSGIYISNRINLSQPATSLQVLVSAYKHFSADFRVLYRLFRDDSSEIDQSYILFPGYDNLIDTSGNGYGDLVIDASLNNGKADSFVRASKNDEFLDYQFSVDKLEQFTGFIIKIVMNGTDEAYAPRFKDMRVIALA